MLASIASYVLCDNCLLFDDLEYINLLRHIQCARGLTLLVLAFLFLPYLDKHGCCILAMHGFSIKFPSLC